MSDHWPSFDDTLKILYTPKLLQVAVVMVVGALSSFLHVCDASFTLYGSSKN
jgi:hypothetical protein